MKILIIRQAEIKIIPNYCKQIKKLLAMSRVFIYLKINLKLKFMRELKMALLQAQINRFLFLILKMWILKNS